jgi:hypothetical protein
MSPAAFFFKKIHCFQMFVKVSFGFHTQSGQLGGTYIVWTTEWHIQSGQLGGTYSIDNWVAHTQI